MFPVRTILFPTDFSDCANYAFGLAASLARDHGANLIVLHVATPPHSVTFGELEKMLQQRGGYREELERKLRQFQPPDQVAVEYRLEEGNPAGEILHVAEQSQCGLIVLGTHGRTGLGRVLLGSVAEQVVRKAPCPVVTVKAGPSATPGGEDAR